MRKQDMKEETMNRRSISLAIALVALAFGGCKLSLDGKDLAKSKDDDSSSGSSSSSSGSSGSNSGSSSSDNSGKGAADGKYANSRRYKNALKQRPINHPEGEPWWELHVDSTPSNNASHLKASCDAPENENGICNGLDDDCDGQVDEECGVKESGFQISMAWETYNSVDLWVQYRSWDDFTSKEMTYWQNNAYHKQVPEIELSGTRDAPMLRLGPDGKGNCFCAAKKIVNGKILKCGPGCSEKRGNCVPDDKNQFSEWATFDEKTAPPGIYEIKFHNNSKCGTRGPETDVTLSVSYNGKLVGSFKSGLLEVQGFNFPIVTLYIP